jgi:formylglycine-generating enzyme required for sulfatase activity
MLNRKMSKKVIPLLALVPNTMEASPVSLQKMPSMEEVVAKEGFVPAPSQSEIYRPGAVLMPNERGGHDVVVADCLGVEYQTSVMAQSSFATALALGVSARLGVVKGQGEGSVEKRLSFVDPEQRTIPLSRIRVTQSCQDDLDAASRVVDLSAALLLYDVLVAQIKNTVCTKADASGKIIFLSEAEAAVYAECVMESNSQVPLGYKAVPLDQVVSLGNRDPLKGNTTKSSGWVKGDFSGANSVVQKIEEAERLKAKLTEDLNACLSAEIASISNAAKSDWAQLVPLYEKKGKEAKALGREYFEKYVQLYEFAEAVCENEIGRKSSKVVVAEVAKAKLWLSDTGVSADYEMVLIPKGEFTMGSPKSESGRRDDEFEHLLEMSSFLLGKTEVTQGLWTAIMGTNPSVSEHRGVRFVNHNLPVQNISWCEAAEFANRLSAKEGLSAAYSGVENCSASEGASVKYNHTASGYRMPLEWEWEYAAKSGSNEPYDSSKLLFTACSHGNVGDVTSYMQIEGPAEFFRCKDNYAGLAPVGSYAANAYGLHDMIGNVMEWCGNSYFADVTVATGDNTKKSIRGNSWASGVHSARPSARASLGPNERRMYVGLRLARTVKQ